MDAAVTECVPHLHDRPNPATVKKRQRKQCGGRRVGLPAPDSLTARLFPCRRGVPAERVTHSDREQTKKVVYSVVYGAGGLRLRVAWSAFCASLCAVCTNTDDTCHAPDTSQTPRGPSLAPCSRRPFEWEDRGAEAASTKAPSREWCHRACGVLVCCEGLRETPALTLPACPPLLQPRGGPCSLPLHTLRLSDLGCLGFRVPFSLSIMLTQ